MTSPRVSIILPAYNASPYIGEAIQSLLDQSFSDFECIIVDDASSDGTWEIIQQYAQKDTRIKPIRNEKNAKICISLLI